MLCGEGGRKRRGIRLYPLLITPATPLARIRLAERRSILCNISIIVSWFVYMSTINEINSVLGHDSTLVRLYWAADNLG